ncbi:hypothetical protein [Streptomyces lateritius]|uniref:hypothetical protein n=1 Tax=Streptomyces lateritius TaxID=67313 RepID=UPI001C8C8D59|nr:hypothetical protein [Streptomyces lateritius]MBX9427013.1 hypothetical protein [Streptomyces lateritius]
MLLSCRFDVGQEVALGGFTVERDLLRDLRQRYLMHHPNTVIRNVEFARARWGTDTLDGSVEKVCFAQSGKALRDAHGPVPPPEHVTVTRMWSDGEHCDVLDVGGQDRDLA